MSNDPTTHPPIRDGVPIFWLWTIVGAALLLLLSWLFRYPWG
jgi:hypothetical protein